MRIIDASAHQEARVSMYVYETRLRITSRSCLLAERMLKLIDRLKLKARVRILINAGRVSTDLCIDI